MLSDKEREKLEREFQYALDNIVSKIKGETATAIVCSEQSMILLFEKLMIKIEKQSKEIELLKEENEKYKNPPFFDEDKYTENDKIKAKIEEYENKGMTVNLANRSAGKTFQQAVHYEVKRVLQSLLEKE